MDRYSRLQEMLSRFGPPQTGPGDLEDYLIDVTVQQALACVFLFCPPSIEVDGMVIQTLLPEQNGDKWVQEARARLAEYHDPQRVEDELNFVLIGRLFRDNPDEPHGAEHLLAELVADAWRGWLPFCYPQRQFEVAVETPEQSGEDYVGITYWQRKTPSSS